MTVAALAAQTAPEMLFTMGLPGAGKSTSLVTLGYYDTHTPIDPDAIKATHPDYDPKNPGALHAWSANVAERQFLTACASGEGNFIIDGTGTNSDRMIRRMRQAQAMGFRCTLLYVRVALATAIERNANRERVVPVEIIRSKALDIATAFELVAAASDAVIVHDND